MTEQEEAAIGDAIIALLDLSVIRGGPDHGRVRTGWGTKTPLGLYRTLRRFVMEAEAKREKVT